MSEKPPLPAAVSEWMKDHHDATPSEVMEAVDLDESQREQVEHYCGVTRYFMYHDQNDGEEIRPTKVEWTDVAEWDTSSRDPDETESSG